MGYLSSYMLRRFLSGLLVTCICLLFVRDCIAAPSNRDITQSHDAASEPTIQETTTTPSPNGTGRRRFVLRRASTSTETPRARKRHLQHQTDSYFQPIQEEEGVPPENLMSFLEFGQKLTSPSSNTIADVKHSVTPGYSRRIDNPTIPSIDTPTYPKGINPSTDRPTNPKEITDTPTNPKEINPSTDIPTNPKEINPSPDTPINPKGISPNTDIPTNPKSINPSTLTPTTPKEINPSTDTPTNPKEINPSTGTPTNPKGINPSSDIPTNPKGINPSTITPTNPKEINPSSVTPKNPKVINPSSDTSTNPKGINPSSVTPKNPKGINPSSDTLTNLKGITVTPTNPKGTVSTPVPPALLSMLRAISTPAPLSPSDDAYNDVISNSQRRRRKKLIARRLQHNQNATEIIADHPLNTSAMNAALIRRKSLLQPLRNSSVGTHQQSVLRRPLTRITASSPVENATVRDHRGRNGSSTEHEITTAASVHMPVTLLHNASMNTSSVHNDSISNNGNTPTIQSNLTVDDAKVSPSIETNNSEIASAQQNGTTTATIASVISRVEMTTSTVRTSTTSTPAVIFRHSSSLFYNSTGFIPIVPISRFYNSTSAAYTRYNYNIESTTRRTWRPVSTMRPVDRHTTASTERSSTTTTTTVRPVDTTTSTERSYTTTSTTPTTTTQTTTTTTTSRPILPKVTEGRMKPSETTYISGDSQPSADFTERPPLLGVSRDVAMDDGESAGISVATYALVSLALVTAVGVASYGARHLASRRRRMLDESELSSSETSSVAGATLKRGTPHASSSEDLGTGRLHGGWSEKSVLPPPPPPHPQWHFPRDQLRLQTILGQGNFGQVWKAEAENICGLPGTRLVAVKSTKSCAGERERSDLLRELAIMQQLGAHPNVVTLLGCCTEQEPHLLIMEYVMYGKLLTFLRDHRTRRECLHFSSSDDGGEQALTSRDLTHFAYCVAKGMDYLVSRGIIHRDLAARNVLVDHNKQCKIADFGMSRHARDSTGQVYEPRQKGALPIRWMAPESLVRSVFTHRSDVWSFGILMWEIVTLGSTPYPTMGAREVMRRVREGYRLERPPHCRPELFRVVASCWMADPLRRPDFAELRVELRRLRDEGAACPGGGHVDLQSALPPHSPGPNTAPSTGGPTPSDPGGI